MEVEEERKKARPKPGLVGSFGRMEKTKDVEKEVMGSFLGKKARPRENWLESLVRRTAEEEGSSLASPERRRFPGEMGLKRKSRPETREMRRKERMMVGRVAAMSSP